MEDSTFTPGASDSDTEPSGLPPVARSGPPKSKAAPVPGKAPPARKPTAQRAAEPVDEVEDLEDFEEVAEAPAAPVRSAPMAVAKALPSKTPGSKASTPHPTPAKSQAENVKASQAEAEAEQTEEEVSEDEDEPVLTRRMRLGAWLQNSSAMFISAVVHMGVIIALSMMFIEPEAVDQVREVVSQMLEVPERELLAIELENQITEVTEVTQQIFSSSPVVGTVGASGPQGAVSSPTVDRAIMEQVTNADVKIEGVFLDTPVGKKMIVEAPDGQIGEARAVVENYQEALDQITQEILWMLEKGDVLVVWAFDQSESMKNDQKEIRDRMEHVYKQLGLVSKHNSDSLETAVVSYGEKFAVHTRKPTSDLDEIRAAISEVPNDPSGKEMMCSAAGAAISMFRPYAQRTNRQMALIVLTDESGEQADNQAQLERALAEAKAARCKIYVMGREAVFGYPYAHLRWIHPQTKRVHWIRIDRGPETAFVEQLQTDGFHRRYDAHPSGYGPYECTRLGRETGGIFFLLPSLETDLVRGEKRKYALEAMRPYLPDLRSRMEVGAERDQSVLRTMLTKVIYDLNPYNPEAAKIIVMRVEFAVNPQDFVKQARQEQAKAIIYLQYLAKAEQEVAKLSVARRNEANPRWQANYDLLYAQLVAYQARMYEYGAYLEEFIKDPKVVPAFKSPNLTHTHWDIVTRQRTITGDVVKPYMDRASVMFKDIISNHPGTPWALRAEHELKRGFGVELVADYDTPIPKLPPGTPLIPVPKM